MDELQQPEEAPEHFPMGLAEYAETIQLDPVLTAALAVYVPKMERMKAEWDVILAEYRLKPITC